MFQEPALDLEPAAPGVAGKTPVPVGRHHAVTGDEQRNGVGAAGTAHGPRTGAQLFRQLAVGDAPPRRYLLQLLPHPLLKGGSPWRQRQAFGPGSTGQPLLDGITGLPAHRAFPHVGRWRLLRDGHPADPPLLHMHRDPPQGGVATRAFFLSGNRICHGTI